MIYKIIAIISIPAPYSVYKFQVVASTSIGEGLEFSPAQNFSTKQYGN